MRKVLSSPIGPVWRHCGRRFARQLGSIALVLALALLGMLVAALPASAHGGDPSKEGYVLVQQALGHLAHDTTHDGMDLAMEKINDALAVEDHEGVAIGEVRQAKRALEADDIAGTRTLLQNSIREAVAALGPATGEETGTTVVRPELAGRGALSARDWSFLVVAVIVLLGGAALSYLYRPAESLKVLRRDPDLAAAGLGGAHRPQPEPSRADSAGESEEDEK